MILDVHRELRDFLEIRATRLVIKDDQGRPLAVFLQLGDGHVRFIDAREPDFEAQIKAMGLDRVVILARTPINELHPPRIKN